MRGRVRRPADKGELLVRFSDKVKLFFQIEIPDVRELADREVIGKTFEFHENLLAYEKRETGKKKTPKPQRYQGFRGMAEMERFEL